MTANNQQLEIAARRERVKDGRISALTCLENAKALIEIAPSINSIQFILPKLNRHLRSETTSAEDARIVRAYIAEVLEPLAESRKGQAPPGISGVPNTAASDLLAKAAEAAAARQRLAEESKIRPRDWRYLTIELDGVSDDK